MGAPGVGRGGRHVDLIVIVVVVVLMFAAEVVNM